uniref:HTH CENPB-type domain-containing protein n=1 Tax=Ditylenchus dipsaci TaxID=166011 RepID=A0A915DU17_9BILA
MSTLSKKRRVILLEDKKKINALVDQKKTYAKIGTKFGGLSKSTIATIVKDRQAVHSAIEDGNSSKRARLQPVMHHDVKESVLQWLKHARSRNIPVTGPLLAEKARILASGLAKKLRNALEDIERPFDVLQRYMESHEVDPAMLRMCDKIDDFLAKERMNKLKQNPITNFFHRVPGTGGAGSQNQAGQINQFMPMDNMFLTSKDDDKKFEVFPEVSMKNTPIYRTAAKYETGMYRFRPTTGQDLIQLLQRCRDLQQNPNIGMQPMQGALVERFGRENCPDNPAATISECGDSVPCMHDYVMFNSKVLGFQMQNNWNMFEVDRLDVMRQYNSCGPINIEYPEYLTKLPAFASGYLQGDVVRFDCFQTHWIKGDYEYKCSLVSDYNNPNSYRFEWNKGDQPWCRSREMDNFLKYLVAILAVVFFLMVLIFIFLACWCIKQKRLNPVFDKMPIRPNSASPPFSRKYENEGFDQPQTIPIGAMSPASRVSSPELRQRAAGGGSANPAGEMPLWA